MGERWDKTKENFKDASNTVSEKVIFYFWTSKSKLKLKYFQFLKVSSAAEATKEKYNEALEKMKA